MRERRTRDLLASSTTIVDPKGYEDFALQQLRQAGFRITMPRVQVIRALGDTNIALSAYAIHEKIVSGGGKIDVVSVYRILATLQEVGLIHHIGIVDGYFPCRIPDTAGRRSEVLVDEQTQNVRELQLPDALMEVIQAQAADLGFEVYGVKVEIIGSLPQD